MIESVRNLRQKLRMHPCISGLVLVLAVIGSVAAGHRLWTQYHLDAARLALDRYAFDEAQRHLNLCLALPFRDDSIYLLAARTARRRDSYQEAERYLAACKPRQATTKALSLERLLVTAQQGELDGIEGALHARTVSDDPEALLVLEALSKGYVQRFWRTEALACVNELLHRQPGHPQALLLRARLKEEMNAQAKADHEYEAEILRDYEKAIEASPSFDARLGRAGALFRLGQPWDALVQYEQLRPLGESQGEVMLGIARCRFNLGELDAARQLLDELLEQSPQKWDALLERGRLALHSGQPAEAEKWLRRAVDLAPACETGPLRSLGQCLASQHKDEEARRCLDRLSKLEADLLQVELLTSQANRDRYNVALRYEIGTKLMRLGRERDSVAALYFVLEQQPRHGPAHAALADYFDRVGQPERAARHRSAAAEITLTR